MEQSALNNSLEKPLVSIVVPVYNVEKYLSKCLNSLINQTYTNVEIIVVNDGSTDNGPQIIRDFEEKDARIKVIHKPNGGLASARNAGVALATGKYIWHVDSDDYTNTGGLEKMVEVAIRDNSDIVVSAHYKIPDEKNMSNCFYHGPKFNKIISGEDALCLMLFTNIGGDVWCKLYKRTLYVENNILQKEEFSACEDVLLNYQLYSKAKIVSPLEYATVYHLYREKSLSSQAKAKMKNFIVSHHLGLVYMANYGFLSESVKKAYCGYLGSDFLRCFKCWNKEILKEISALNVKTFELYLYYLSKYKKVKRPLIRLSFKRKYIYGLFGITPVRFFTACFMKIFTLFFKTQ
ncbi:MAG: glycosyltransferase family 2 protein [Tannerella sp.]|jgi:glycosyltransferase involved in cell wall biosynthesis|nr:glycosyltransferase family 2 protein [Tannerella sp.]